LLTDVAGFVERSKPSGDSYLGPMGSLFERLEVDGQDLVVRFTDVGPRVPGRPVLVGTAEMRPLSRIDTVKPGVDYITTLTALPAYDYELAFGPDYGILTVPFKLQMRDGSITAGATLGPYFGWKQRWLGFASTVTLAAGLSVIPVQNVNSGSVETKVGLTGAFGVIAQPVGQVQMGVLAGLDHLGGDAGRAYQYENRLWVSFAIGFGFLQ
jgi:hypothetical protein